MAGCSFPPNAENELKFARDVSFVNTVKHPSGEIISMPPSEPEYGQWMVSDMIKTELDLVREGIYGKQAKDLTLENYRICW